MIEGRVPPQAVDVEAQILGAMLLEREAIAKVVEILNADHFHADYHRKIYQAMVQMFECSEPIDTITLSEELRKKGQLELIGGEPYLVELTMKVVSAANIENHARIVIEKAVLREMIAVGSTMVAKAYQQIDDPFELAQQAEESIFAISQKRLHRSSVTMHQATHAAIEHLEAIHSNKNHIPGIRSGFRDLDNLTGGWHDGHVVYIAGRPSSGKTAFALSLVRNADVPTAIFSLEMTTQELMQRLLTAEAKVDAHGARTGRLAEDDWKRLSLAAGRLATKPIYIDDTADLGILELRAKARRLKAERAIKMIVVDYLQLMKGPKNAETREREVAEISRNFKILAKELNIPVIALSQLSRRVESRSSQRPILSDLRESGNLEQDADEVIFIHRPEMYEEPNTKEWREVQGQAEVIVAKQRNGPTDDLKLVFVSRYAKFENPAPASFSMEPQREEETPF